MKRSFANMLTGFACFFMPISGLSAQTSDTRTISDSETAIAAFSDLCVATFPDEQDFLNGMAMNNYGFIAAPRPKLPHRWAGEQASLVYADASMMQASGQPAPQCIINVTIPNGDDHLALARIIESQLLIEDGSSEGRGGVNRTIWNFFDDAGNQLRIFFQSRQINADRLAVRMTLLRIAAGTRDITPQEPAPQPDPGLEDTRPVLDDGQIITNPELQPDDAVPGKQLQLEDEVLP